MHLYFIKITIEHSSFLFLTLGIFTNEGKKFVTKNSIMLSLQQVSFKLCVVYLIN